MISGTSEVLGRELYDSQQDPQESRNRAADPASRTSIKQLTTQLRTLVRAWPLYPPEDASPKRATSQDRTSHPLCLQPPRGADPQVCGRSPDRLRHFISKPKKPCLSLMFPFRHVES